ncbi:MAG: hypothetical protein LBU62_04500, partial [Bacteroidales bacterium]|nr:hypothetical protein [Bacteroidales bacterium]
MKSKKVFLEIGSIKGKGTEIEVDMCSYSFMREIDNYGKIRSDLMGGNISLAITQIPPIGILNWGLRNIYFNGFVHFKDDSGQISESLSFENAACVNMVISYENEGQSYLATQITLQSEIINLHGDYVLFNHWMREKPVATYTDTPAPPKEVSASLKKHLPDIDATYDASSITAYMVHENKQIELKSFEMDFGQEVDHNVEPQSEVVGGIATITLFGMPDESINRWMIKKESWNGKFQFGDPLSGYPMTIEFQGAECIGYCVQSL